MEPPPPWDPDEASLHVQQTGDGIKKAMSWGYLFYLLPNSQKTFKRSLYDFIAMS